MSFEGVFTDEASLQALQIQHWIAERTFEGAIAWQKALRLAIGKMRERVDASSLAPESSQFSEPLFQILFKTRRVLTYRGLFVVRDQTVFVVSVRGYGRDLVTPSDVVMPD